jgi:hypothetical protein
MRRDTECGSRNAEGGKTEGGNVGKSKAVGWGGMEGGRRKAGRKKVRRCEGRENQGRGSTGEGVKKEVEKMRR